MKKITILLFLISITVHSQKVYQIENIEWTYSRPENYVYKIDNFKKIIDKGKELLNDDSKIKFDGSDVVLFTLAKTEKSDMNVIIATYRNDEMLKTYTMKGYLEKLVSMMTEKFDQLGLKSKITSREVEIDKITFYVIESEITNVDGYTYQMFTYRTHIGNKEFGIATVYDNNTDKSLIINSINSSKFKIL